MSDCSAENQNMLLLQILWEKLIFVVLVIQEIKQFYSKSIFGSLQLDTDTENVIFYCLYFFFTLYVVLIKQNFVPRASVSALQTNNGDTTATTNNNGYDYND